MTYTTLISTEELSAHLADPDWVVVDCRFRLNDPAYGRRAYERSHIAGAIYMHLDDDLSGPIIPGQTGRHPLPAVEEAARRFSSAGIDSGTQVVAYDDMGGALAAARLWWMLRWLGHDRVAVLDGGWMKWLREKRPSRRGAEQKAPRRFTPRVRPEVVVSADDVLRSLGDPDIRLFDSRTADRYRGENETIDPVAGHIPGAISAPYPDSLDQTGCFKPREALRARFEALLGGLPAEQAVFYCGSGGTAPLNILAMLYAGLGEAKLYAGSWSDWILDPSRPVKTGEEA
jgi:thiosulfate/3-mercaptopyruvate sulfurtransferase